MTRCMELRIGDFKLLKMGWGYLDKFDITNQPSFIGFIWKWFSETSKQTDESDRRI